MKIYFKVGNIKSWLYYENLVKQYNLKLDDRQSADLSKYHNSGTIDIDTIEDIWTVSELLNITGFTLNLTYDEDENKVFLVR
jgi:hypothetical protein